MNEDRRPNVGGVSPLPDDTAPQETPAEDLEREARLLRDRERVDGHEPADPDAGEDRAGG